MKKILITLSFIVSGFYLSFAINLNLRSGDVLSNSSWQEVSNITDKINLSSNNLNIEGKLVSSGKICAGSSCLGECDEGKIWDINTSSCISLATTPETAALSCKDLYDNYSNRTDGVYYIKPNGFSGDAFKVYCDMTTDGGGWTYLLPPTISGLTETEINDNLVSVTYSSGSNQCSTLMYFAIKEKYNVFRTYVCGGASTYVKFTFNNLIGATQVRFSSYSGGNSSYIRLNGSSVYTYTGSKNKFALGANEGICNTNHCYFSVLDTYSTPIIKTISSGQNILQAGGVGDNGSWGGYGMFWNVAIK